MGQLKIGMVMPLAMLIAILALQIQDCQCLFSPDNRVRPRQVEVPLVTNFRRRALQSIAVLGNYLYIDGGEISQIVNGEADSAPSRPVNITESIPLDQAWTNATVRFKSIERSAPNAKFPALWVDNDTNTIYEWGGEGPYQNTTGANDIQLWAFTADSEGGGSWAARAPNNLATFTDIYRGTNGAATTCNGVGFLLGGMAVPATDARFDGTVPLPGLLTYDMKSATWANRSATFPYATMYGGTATCLPFGPNGLIIFLGGTYELITDSSVFTPILFDNLTFYDPVANKWFSQMASGENNEIPEGRQVTCSIGVAGPNGTFEIFIYGGYDNTAQPNTLSDIWVLSLPGFQWFRSSIQGTPRWAHSCALIGNRQMIVVGGVPSYTGGFVSTNPSTDPWVQGLGILDLPSLNWSDQYDPGAPAYDSPDMVKNWYSNGGLASVRWGSNEVKSLFINGSTPTTSSTSSTPSNSSPPAPGQSGSPTGAIIGGTMGGVALLALISGAVLYYYPRKRSRSKYLSSQDHNQQYGLGQKAELDTHQARQNNIYPLPELPHEEIPLPELPHEGIPPQELP